MKGPDAANKLPAVTPHAKVVISELSGFWSEEWGFQYEEKHDSRIDLFVLVSSEAVEGGEDQGLLADGGGIHQQSGWEW